MAAADHRGVVRYAGAFSTYIRSTAKFGEALERAQQGFQSAEALSDPRPTANCQNNLGVACSDLQTGDRGENLKRAIGCYEAALRVRTERELPTHWATTQNNLGLAYWVLPTGDRGTNIQRAVACYEAALRVRTEHEFPIQWAETQNNPGNAYEHLPSGERGQNLQRAVESYEAAIRGYRSAGLSDEAERASQRLEEARHRLAE